MSHNDSGGHSLLGEPAATTTTSRQPSAPINTEPTGHQLAEQLRRRRAASWRCPMLECGRRDPLDPDPGPAIRWRQRLADARAAEHHAESWAAAVAHLAELGHDVTFAVPPEITEQRAS